jgi:hypothetical protein
VSTASRKHWRLVSSTACSALAFFAAGCGGGGTSEDADALPRALGATLVAQTAEVEDALAADDTATAREEALDLQRRVSEAIDAGRVPASLQEPLRSAVEDLIDLINEETPTPSEEEDDHGKDKKDKGKGKGKGQDDEAATTTVEDSTSVSDTGTTTGADG